MKNPTIFFVFLPIPSCIVLYLDFVELWKDFMMLWKDFGVLWKDSIVFGEDSTVVWEDFIVVWEDSIVVWEDSIVLSQENCIRKIAAFPYEIYSCEMWKFAINRNSFPGDKKKGKTKKWKIT